MYQYFQSAKIMAEKPWTVPMSWDGPNRRKFLGDNCQASKLPANHTGHVTRFRTHCTFVEPNHHTSPQGGMPA